MNHEVRSIACHADNQLLYIDKAFADTDANADSPRSLTQENFCTLEVSQIAGKSVGSLLAVIPARVFGNHYFNCKIDRQNLKRDLKDTSVRRRYVFHNFLSSFAIHLPHGAML